MTLSLLAMHASFHDRFSDWKHAVGRFEGHEKSYVFLLHIHQCWQTLRTINYSHRRILCLSLMYIITHASHTHGVVRYNGKGLRLIEVPKIQNQGR